MRGKGSRDWSAWSWKKRWVQRLITKLRIFVQIRIFITAIKGTKFLQKFVSTTGHYNKSDTLNVSHIFAYYAHSSNLKFLTNA